MNAMKERRILVFGDVNLDIFIPGERTVPPPGTEKYIEMMPACVGGGAAITAMGLAKLGMPVSFMGAIAADTTGEIIRDTFRKLKIDLALTTKVRRVSTGISLSFTDKSDRSFISYMGNNAHTDIGRLEKTDLTDFSHLHITGCNPDNFRIYLSTLKKIKSKYRITVSCDMGYDETGKMAELLKNLIPYIDIFFMNEVEVKLYSGCDSYEKAAGYFTELGTLAVIKEGANGSMCMKKGGRLISEATQKVEAVDTTGAGDSFNAGFLYGFLNDYDMRDSLKIGNYCGSCAVTAFGGNTAFPDKNKLEEFIS